MRKTAMIMITLLIGFQTVLMAQESAIRKYGEHSVESTKNFVLENKICRDTLLNLVHRKLRQAGYSVTLSASEIFNYVEEQEVWLEARQWKNSRWTSPQKEAIEFYISESRYEGDAGIFIYEDCSFPLYKKSCDNFIDASLNGVAKTPHTVMVPKKIVVDTEEVKDTIYVPVWVEAPQERENIRVEVIYVNESRGYGPNYGYQEPYYMPLYIPSFYWGWNAGRNNGDYRVTNIDNSSYYYNNQVTNTTNTTNTHNTHSNYNYSNNNNNYGSPTYPPTPNTGGPGGAGMNTNGNGYGGPSGTRMNNDGNGYGGPSGTGTNGTGGTGGAGMNTNLGNNTNQNSSTGTGMNTNTSGRSIATRNNQRVKSRDINPQARTSEDGIYSSNRNSKPNTVSTSKVANNQVNRSANNSSYRSNNRSSSSNNQARQSSNQQSRSSNGYGSNNHSSSSNRPANNSGYGSNRRN
ncbi:MAG: hypothetical protein JJE53_02940 [Candidatus Pacebacteria bacterium]|nr:hypothetical protein [Candidatus Paceibacterota bacterium]